MQQMGIVRPDEYECHLCGEDRTMVRFYHLHQIEHLKVIRWQASQLTDMRRRNAGLKTWLTVVVAAAVLIIWQGYMMRGG